MVEEPILSRREQAGSIDSDVFTSNTLANTPTTCRKQSNKKNKIETLIQY